MPGLPTESPSAAPSWRPPEVGRPTVRCLGFTPLSEDLQDGQNLAGVVVINPFAHAPSSIAQA